MGLLRREAMANEEFKAVAINPSAFVLPKGILTEDACIIDEQENHVVLTVRVPLDLIRDNQALLRSFPR
jgi:hypothetical protein